MSTTMVRTEDVKRNWYVLDAAGKPLGKTAALAADLLRGKRKVDYTPHVDGGDFVIIVICTGEKVGCMRERATGKLHEIMLIRTDGDLAAFCRRCQVEQKDVRTVY